MIYSCFSPYGLINNVYATKRPGLKGQAFVIFCNLEDAAKARRALNGSNFLNKPIKVDFTKNDANLVQKYKSKFGGGSGAKTAANIANQVKNAAKRIAKTSGTLLVTNLPDDVLDSHLHMLFSP